MQEKSGYYDKLEQGAVLLMQKLLKKGIRVSIIEDSFRQYSVKLSLEEKGIISLFYSPKKDEYKITLNEIKDEKVSEKILKFWESGSVKQSKKKDVYRDKGFEIDVDGSYIKGHTSWASIIRKDGKVIKQLSGIVDTSNIKNSHQIAGEIKAVIESVKYCLRHGIKTAVIYYDYNGLKYWAKGLWRAKIFVTQYYQDFMKEVKMNIEWVKIKSHTGVYWNEQADKLAKKAIEDKSRSGS